MVKAKELRDQTEVELEALVGDKRKELFDLRVSFAREKKTSGTHSARALKKDIARILTILREKEINKRDHGAS